MFFEFKLLRIALIIILGNAASVFAADERHKSIELDVASVRVTTVTGEGLSLMERDVTVKGALQRWCQNNGWQLIWESDIDFLIETEMNYGSEIQSALRTLFDHLAMGGPRLHAVMYSQNSVLIVKKLY